MLQRSAVEWQPRREIVLKSRRDTSRWAVRLIDRDQGGISSSPWTALTMGSTSILRGMGERSLVVMSKMFRDWLIDICILSGCTVIFDDPTSRNLGF